MEMGLKYNLEQRTKRFLEYLVTGTESATQQKDFNQREAIRFMSTNSIAKLMRKPHPVNLIRQLQHPATISLRWKPQSEKLTITKVDKGNTMVIINNDDLHSSVGVLKKKVQVKYFI
jgi:hypothetical protein